MILYDYMRLHEHMLHIDACCDIHSFKLEDI